MCIRDSSGAYAARWVAKNVVAAGLAARCEIQLAYAIGMARPVSVMIDTFGTNEVDEAAIERAVGEVFDLRPGAIIDELDPVSYTHLDVYKRQGKHHALAAQGDAADAGVQVGHSDARRRERVAHAQADAAARAGILVDGGDAVLGERYGPLRACLLYTSRCV